MKNYKLSVLLLSLLWGCTPEVADWTPAESPKHNKVDRAIFTYHIHMPAHANEFGKKEKESFVRFLKLHAARPSSVSVILVEHGGQSEKRIKDIKREIIRHGVDPQLITVESEEEEAHDTKHKHFHKKHPKGHGLKHHKKHHSSGVEVIVEQYLVIPPTCADFSQPIGDARQAHSHSNFGCSTRANLGMMVANPRDLTEGRKEGNLDGTFAAAGVNRYRAGKTTPLMDTSTTTAPTAAATPTTAASTGASSVTGGTY